jgi:hypothetical protein
MTNAANQRNWLGEARWTAIILSVCVATVIGLYCAGVDSDAMGLWIVRVGAVPLTLFVLLYGFTVRWWEFWIGRALMVSSTGTAALIDLALLNRQIGREYALAEPLLLAVLVFMSAGGVLKLVALLVDKVPLWRGKRIRRVPESSER